MKVRTRPDNDFHQGCPVIYNYVCVLGWACSDKPLTSHFTEERQSSSVVSGTERPPSSITVVHRCRPRHSDQRWRDFCFFFNQCFRRAERLHRCTDVWTEGAETFRSVVDQRLRWDRHWTEDRVGLNVNEGVEHGRNVLTFCFSMWRKKTRTKRRLRPSSGEHLPVRTTTLLHKGAATWTGVWSVSQSYSQINWNKLNDILFSHLFVKSFPSFVLAGLFKPDAEWRWALRGSSVRSSGYREEEKEEK